MLGAMLLFRFEGLDRATRKELVLACVPLIVLDYSIVTFLIGLVAWYASQSSVYRSALVGISTGIGILFGIWLSFDMVTAMRRPGGMGRDELKYIEQHPEVVQRSDGVDRVVRNSKPPFQGGAAAVKVESTS